MNPRASSGLGPPTLSLPVALTSFVGRKEELDQVGSALRGSRLVTLTGVGGAGKTRLALHLSAAVVERFPDGAWLVELAPLRDPDLVVVEVAAALGLLPTGLAITGDPLEEALCDQLRRRRLLLILDNCEHLVDATARLVHAILAHCPDVAVLATSREVLGIPGEMVFRVPPLSLPPLEGGTPEELSGSDAVTLFCERARAAEPGFGLSAANTGAVARICRNLDGIPLALELAAARIRMLGAHQVAQRLDRRFRLLGGGARTAVPRHQTLRAAIDWSDELLPVGEQGVLRCLAAFPGTFDLAAAEAVIGDVAAESAPAGPGFEVLDLLTRLLDKSLLVVSSEDPDVRYRLLETIQEYAGEKLAEAGEAADAHQRHRDFFLGFSEEWRLRTFESWHQEPWLSKAATELDNFRTALEWSAAQGDDEAILRLAAPIGHYWMLSGYLDGCQWLERAVATPGSTSIPARVEVRILEALGSHSGQGFGHYYLAWLALSRGGIDEAEVHLDRALRLARQSDDRFLAVHVLAVLTLVAALSGQADRAAQLGDEAVLSARPFPARQVLVMALTRAAEAAILCGRPDRGTSLVGELLSLLRELGIQRWSADALEMTGTMLGSTTPEPAAVLLGASQARREALGEPAGAVGTLAETVRECQEALLVALGPERLDQARHRGRTMPVDEAISYALAELKVSEAADKLRV